MIMSKLYKGFIETKGKASIEKLKNRTTWKTYDEVKNLNGFGGVLADDTILIDIDDSDQSEILMNIVEELQLDCKVLCTSNGDTVTQTDEAPKAVKDADPVQNFSIDAKSVDCKIELVDGKYNITINADQQQTLVDDSANGSSMDWLQIIQAVLLVAILICLVRKPKDRQ